MFFGASMASIEAHLTFLDALECNTMLVPADATLSIVEEILSKRQTRRAAIPSLEPLLETGKVPLYPFSKTFEDTKLDPYVLLHTSGTTSLPNP